jgi:anti-anti-sigma factor
VIGVADLAYADSSAIGMFVGIYKHMAASGGQLRIAGANKTLLKIITLVRLDRVFTLDDTVEASCQGLAA